MYLFVNYLDVSVSTLEWGEEQWTKEHLSKSTGTLQIEMIVLIGLKWVWNWKLFGFVGLRQLIEEYRREWRRSRVGCNNYFLINYFACNNYFFIYYFFCKNYFLINYFVCNNYFVKYLTHDRRQGWCCYESSLNPSAIFRLKNILNKCSQYER